AGGTDGLFDGGGGDTACKWLRRAGVFFLLRVVASNFTGRKLLILDDIKTPLLEFRQRIQHCLQYFGRVLFPVLDQRNNPQWMTRAIGACGISRESLVGEIRIVLERP